jgi:Fis family transcriptional regulator, factor for inversion stimulation protein
MKQKETIKQCISGVMDQYFSDMGNHFNGDLYELVMKEVEKPLIQKVLTYTKNNQTSAANILGISRGTLKKKVDHYRINTNIIKK